MEYQPDFTKFVFERPKGYKPGVEVNKPHDWPFSLFIEWTKTPSARSVIISSPDGDVWKITAEKVEQYKAPELAALEEVKED